MDKATLRKTIMKQRSELSQEEVQRRSKKICEKILRLPEYKSSKVVYLYYPINNEVDLRLVAKDCLEKGKTMAFPKVIDGQIEFFVASSEDDFEPGAYNIPEPKEDIKAPKADLLLAPGVAFSIDAMRVGYGGGMYDRFLSKNSVHTIGVCYSFQLLNRVPTLAHDERLDEIIYDE